MADPATIAPKTSGEALTKMRDLRDKKGVDTVKFDAKSKTLVKNTDAFAKLEALKQVAVKAWAVGDTFRMNSIIGQIEKLSSVYQNSFNTQVLKGVPAKDVKFAPIKEAPKEGEMGSKSNPLVVPYSTPSKHTDSTWLTTLADDGATAPVITLPADKHGLPETIKVPSTSTITSEKGPDGTSYFQKIFVKMTDKEGVVGPTEEALGIAVTEDAGPEGPGGTQLVVMPGGQGRAALVITSEDGNKVFLAPKQMPPKPSK